MSTSKLICISVTRDGATSKIHCTKEVADMLVSKEIGTVYFVDFVNFFILYNLNSLCIIFNSRLKDNFKNQICNMLTFF